jgi:hypothetical protein
MHNDWNTSGVSAPFIISDNGVTQQVKATLAAGSRGGAYD